MKSKVVVIECLIMHAVNDTCMVTYWIQSLNPVTHATVLASPSKGLQECGDDPASSSRDNNDNPGECSPLTTSTPTRSRKKHRCNCNPGKQPTRKRRKVKVGTAKTLCYYIVIIVILYILG